jgi:hypothetical protein
VGSRQAPAPLLLVWPCTFFLGGVQRMCENMLHSATRLRTDWEPQVEAFRIVVRGLAESVRGSRGSGGGQGPDPETWQRAMQVPLAFAHFVAAVRPLFALLCRVRARLAAESARPCRHQKHPPPAPPNLRGVRALSSLAICVLRDSSTAGGWPLEAWSYARHHLLQQYHLLLQLLPCACPCAEVPL